jgi:hypothetical protein
VKDIACDYQNHLLPELANLTEKHQTCLDLYGEIRNLLSIHDWYTETFLSSSTDAKDEVA